MRDDGARLVVVDSKPEAGISRSASSDAPTDIDNAPSGVMARMPNVIETLWRNETHNFPCEARRQAAETLRGMAPSGGHHVAGLLFLRRCIVVAGAETNAAIARREISASSAERSIEVGPQPWGASRKCAKEWAKGI